MSKTVLKKTALSVLLLALGATAGYYGQQYAPELLESAGMSDKPAADEPLYWVAPMDPNYRRDTPGLSPMGMELVPVYAEDQPGGDSPGTVKIDASVENNLGVRTGTVGFGVLQQTIRTVGYVGFDEGRLQHIHTRLPGWVRKLHVKTDGAYIEQGQPLYELYAPELITAQEEYLTALRSNNHILARSARDKLRALSVADGEIRALRKRGRTRDTITVAAPISGYVDQLAIREGMYVMPAQTLMSLGPLNEVWVLAEVLERQAPWLETGSSVKMQLDYQPGRFWQGRVDYIYPTLDPKTRARKVRLRFDNSEGGLQPGMFARVEIVGRRSQPRLHIPAEALIQTADQQRVVVALGEGKYKSVAVLSGLRAGGRVAILEGLELGDSVVTSAQFLLDSESAVSSDLQRISNPEMPWPTAWVNAEVVAINRENRTLTLRHGEILRWNRPAMAMVLPVDDGLSLAGLQPALKLKVQLASNMGDVTIRELLIPEQPLPWQQSAAEPAQQGGRP
ncbi:MAG: efflux RND transporter periplasmic adaptor subunit [Marinobacterium sp.]|nr:efflux RND transporter periplasmic adaptor subunit [Marinobacterium sp.]